ncbi:capsid cement protein [Actinoallomurus sp. CA-142502]|uniref:capsid cement protein n=1 Tax=Actinoallomurus sp. CA-142502 TaxID=3239885 RepID=UPI003D93A83C
MATNITHEDGDCLDLVCTDPAVPASGDPVRVGQLPGVAQTKERADGTTSVKLNGTATFSVKGVDGSGNAAVAVGDLLYYVDADTPKLSKKATGVRFGYALGAVTSGATASIEVKIGY